MSNPQILQLHESLSTSAATDSNETHDYPYDTWLDYRVYESRKKDLQIELL